MPATHEAIVMSFRCAIAREEAGRSPACLAAALPPWRGMMGVRTVHAFVMSATEYAGCFCAPGSFGRISSVRTAA